MSLQIIPLVLKLQNRGEWIRHKWNVKRGYLKYGLTVDTKKKRIISLNVTSEQFHDSQVLSVLIDDTAIEPIKLVACHNYNGSYDNNKNFQYLSFKGINPIIKVRKNSKCRKTNHYLQKQDCKDAEG